MFKMSGEQEDASSSSVPGHLTTSNVEETIVSTVQQLSSALLDTSCNIQSLDSKLHKYHQEQNAAVQKLKEDINACKEHINSSSCRPKNGITFEESGSRCSWQTSPAYPSRSSESPTNPWKMLRDKEEAIVELERKNQTLQTKYETAQERLRSKCGELSHQLLDTARQLAEEKKRFAEMEGELRSSEREAEERRREIARLEKQIARSEEDLEKQLAKAEIRVEMLEQELASQKSRNANDRSASGTELGRLHLELRSWQEKYSREKQKSSRLSEELSRLEADRQRGQTVENSKLREEVDSLKDKCKAREEKLSETSSKYDALKKEYSHLKRKLAQKERAEDVSQPTKSSEYERLQLEKRDIEEVCLSFDRKFQKQMLVQKKLEQRLGDCHKKVQQLTESKQQTQKALEDLSQYVNEKVDLVVGLLSMRSSDTFQALFASDLVVKPSPMIQIAELKSKLHWVMQEVRGLCMLEMELKARASRSTGYPPNGVRRAEGKKTGPL